MTVLICYVVCWLVVDFGNLNCLIYVIFVCCCACLCCLVFVAVACVVVVAWILFIFACLGNVMFCRWVVIIVFILAFTWYVYEYY